MQDGAGHKFFDTSFFLRAGQDMTGRQGRAEPKIAPCRHHWFGGLKNARSTTKHILEDKRIP